MVAHDTMLEDLAGKEAEQHANHSPEKTTRKLEERHSRAYQYSASQGKPAKHNLRGAERERKTANTGAEVQTRQVTKKIRQKKVYCTY